MDSKRLTLDDYIGTRELDVLDANGNLAHRIKVTIGKPIQLADREWTCPYRISGLGDDAIYQVNGLDAIQAIKCAFTVIDGILKGSEPFQNGRLKWNGDNDLGF